MHYDTANRCFTNKPELGDPKQIAVMPARYGLFVAKKVTASEVSVATTGEFKGKGGIIDAYDDRKDRDLTFILPFRKVIANDPLFNSGELTFTETHVNEKLSILLKDESLKRNSKTLIDKSINADLKSSFLVIPKPAPLLTKIDGVSWDVDDNSENRYFTTFSKKNNIVIEVMLKSDYRIPNDYSSPRNEPMYVHITHKMNNDGNYSKIPQTENSDFEKFINTGDYSVPVFEDGICDGVVSVCILHSKNPSLGGITKKGILPAFSIITAPDFFPIVDLFDIMDFDVAPGFGKESNFYEGGTASLAAARIRPNPKLLDPCFPDQYAFPSLNNHDTSYNTITAVLATPQKKTPTFKKDYYNCSSFLPDSCSSVFAPGWDVTYGNTGDNSYLSTKGLGSPFVEDMKLCAAMNGMWAVSSPDAARTYQGTVTTEQSQSPYYWYANPTAIPLLDDEIGFHKNSSAVK